MNREETIAFYEKCQASDDPAAMWNAWANEMLAEKVRLEEEGLWEENYFSWSIKSNADFCGYQFNEQAIFMEWKFPGYTRFDKCEFNCNSVFYKAHFFQGSTFIESFFHEKTIFENAIFSGKSDFSNSKFSKSAIFKKCYFQESVNFNHSELESMFDFSFSTVDGSLNFCGILFHDRAIFSSVKLNANSDFSHTKFSGIADFVGIISKGGFRISDSIFESDATFSKSNFIGDVDIHSTSFSGNFNFSSAAMLAQGNLTGCHFKMNTTIQKSTFYSLNFDYSTFDNMFVFQNILIDNTSSFRAVTINSFFSLAGTKFAEIPDFTDAHFREAPRLDHVVIEHKPEHYKQGDKERGAKWRALKRMAEQGQDGLNEKHFFKGELLARRGFEDTGAALWINRAYGYFSDFGLSFLRPLGWWATLTVLCACLWLMGALAFYLPAPSAGPGQKMASPFACQEGLPDGRLSAALVISLNRAMIGLPSGLLGQNEGVKQAQICLFGLHDLTPQPVYSGKAASAGSSPPLKAPLALRLRLPLWAMAFGLFQSVASALLIFLFFLALRNRFKLQ